MSTELSSIIAIMRAITGFRERATLFPAVFRAVRDVIPADFVGIVLRDPDERTIQTLTADPPIVLESTRMSDYRISEDLYAGRVLFLDDRELDDYPIHRRLWAGHGVRASLLLPMIVEGRAIGTLVTWWRDPAAPLRVDLKVAAALGTVVAIAVDNCLAYEQAWQLRDEAEDTNAALRAELAGAVALEGMIGASPSFAAVREQIERVAATAATVLLTGESGTGKDVVARAIHAASPRREHPMVTVNCAALPAQLAESELFGHEEGAFTGASRARTGRFELAEGSTLFLDEVGELTLDVQAKLLRVLQEREIERVGGGEPIKLDVRIVAATNRDLPAMIEDGKFRQDLYYRLSVFPIVLPPLRARLDDLPALVEAFVERAAQRFRLPRRRVGPEAMRRLAEHDWPGNVRELQHAIERAMIISAGDQLDVDAVVPRRIVEREPAGDPDRQRADYLAALEACNWVIEGERGAAARLGVHPNTFRHRIKKLGIERPKR